MTLSMGFKPERHTQYSKYVQRRQGVTPFMRPFTQKHNRKRIFGLLCQMNDALVFSQEETVAHLTWWSDKAMANVVWF